MNTTHQQRYWNRRVSAKGTWRRDPLTDQPLIPPGEDLAAMRAGLGRPAGSVPALWPFYTCPVDDQAALRGEVSAEQAAEHATLALFGLHQQAQSDPMHRRDTTFGQALNALRDDGKFSATALDVKVAAAATATSVVAMLHRLRGLIEQLRAVHQPVDYDRLMADIHDWHYPDARRRVRSRWGLGYYVWKPQHVSESDEPGAQKS
ncbi:type I-E CRISPR-associated protein Cse2/CasB [Saccharopolyspora sp. K220]|uniref:type I-E CRISPR-associated protein Cse2/CasB n=1 Tax=Saccharopolyspora soli TaxID=2926618 RepID=UPI001F57BDE6|nr:type I-E CRISPR-associated protein Cse2/CasB [Saccharopolyspora soli]MCI2422153.1 type I-E CRISPR-associated protein Cse2/CasB [Saccharopolyspora soli]